MADTGLLQDAATHPWLACGVRPQDPVDDVDPLDPGAPPVIPACAGHGTFGAGVLRCMAPDAEIIMARVLTHGGSRLEADLVRGLGAALALGPDIFHLTMACLSRNDQPLIGFEAWLRLLRRTDAICIAPAGNSGFDRPEFPAAFPGSSALARWAATGVGGGRRSATSVVGRRARAGKGPGQRLRDGYVRVLRVPVRPR